MKGIILAGGTGSRLFPITKVVNKQLLPVYDKPMIYYPLSTLMLANINEILIISTPQDIENYQQLLGDGSQFGIKLSYEVQPKPNGLAEAFIIGEKFLNGEPCAMILGDNIFYGNDFKKQLLHARLYAEQLGSATIFGYQVKDPQRFGIVELGSGGQVISIEEKPEKPKSNLCVTGLYFYPAGVSKKARQVKQSNRGELEITSLNQMYLFERHLKAEILQPGFAWFDTGTIDSLTEATNYVQMMGKIQDMVISAPEEIAYLNGWIDKRTLLKQAESCSKSSYGEYLKKVAETEIRGAHK